MKISVELNDSIAIIKVVGELIGSSGLVPLYEEMGKQTDAGYKKIILDLSKIIRIDSTGLGALINSKDHVEIIGGQIVFFSTCEQVNKVLTTTKIDNAFIICESIDQALLQF